MEHKITNDELMKISLEMDKIACILLSGGKTHVEKSTLINGSEMVISFDIKNNKLE